MMLARHVLLCALGLGVAGAVTAQKPIRYMGRAFVFQAGSTDEKVLDSVASTLTRRVRNTARYPEARVAVEKGGRISVTFVGRQDSATEDWLIAGLASPGQLCSRVVAETGDLAGSGLDEERQRLRRWVEDHPNEPLAAFDGVARESGGPHPALVWRGRRAAPDGTAEPPVPLLRTPVHRFLREHMVKGLRIVRSAPGERRVGFRFELEDKPAEAWKEFHETWAGRDLGFVVNGEVTQIAKIDESPGATVVVGGGFSMAEWRVLLFAVSGGPVDVPLTFVEYSKRELANVRRR